MNCILSNGYLICYIYIFFIAFVGHENRMIDTIFRIVTRLVSEIFLET